MSRLCRTTRRASYLLVFSLAATSLSLVGCADRRSVSDIETHPEAWNEQTSADFHGDRVLHSDAETCRACHGADLRGEGEAPSCSDCHDGAGGHPRGWVVVESTDFHALVVAREGNAECTSCHGANYRGGWSGVSCYDCHAGGPSGHPDGWLMPRSSSFHGLEVLQHGVEDCARCHGFGLSGGTSGVACGDCHP